MRFYPNTYSLFTNAFYLLVFPLFMFIDVGRCNFFLLLGSIAVKAEMTGFGGSAVLWV